MGYACPVCDAPQADAGHLANHLAFTALARGGDHEVWLEAHVSGWADLGEDELADRVVEDAESVEYPQVFEDTTRDAAGGSSRERSSMERATRVPDSFGNVDGDDEDVESVLEAARELTRRRRDEADSREDSETE